MSFFSDLGQTLNPVNLAKGFLESTIGVAGGAIKDIAYNAPRAVYESGAAITGALTHNKVAEQNALNRANEAINTSSFFSNIAPGLAKVEEGGRENNILKAAQGTAQALAAGGVKYGTIAALPFGGEALGALKEAPSLGAKVLSGVASGVKVGGAFGALNAASQDEWSVNSFANDIALGATTGGVLGAAAPLAIEGIKGAVKTYRNTPELNNQSGHTMIPGKEPTTKEAAVSAVTPESPEAKQTKKGSLEYVGSGIKTALDQGVALPEPGKPTLTRKVLGYLTGNKAEANYKPTGSEINATFDSMRREQQVIGKQVGDAITEFVPDQTSREAVTAIKETGGDIGKLRDYAANPELPDNLRAVAQRAVDLLESKDVGTQKALGVLGEFYSQTGATFQDAELVKNLKDNYSNRLYDGAKAKPGDPNLSPGTKHSKVQAYEDPFQAALDGKSPVLDAAELAHRYSDDIARAVPNKIILDNLKTNGLGDYYAPGQVPEGWTTVPGSERNIPYLDKEGQPQVNASVFAVPSELGAAIKPVISPDYFKKVDVLSKAQDVNALAKFGKLGFSLFHWYNEVKELGGQLRGGIDAPKFAQLLKSGDFNEMERFTAKYGITSETSPDAQINILSKLREQDGLLGKATNLPGVKQALAIAQKNNEVLFQKFIPAIKTVNGFQRMMRWVDAHPGATEAETTKAFRGIARETNASHGGINWTQLGKDPSANSLARFSLLAYDWTYSNWDKAKLALTPDIQNAGANAARVSVVSSLITGYVAFKALNQLLNNGETDPDHPFEVKVGNTYVSTYPAVITDALKLATDVQNRGVIGGTAQLAAGKISPVGQVVIGLLSNTNQYGAPLTTAKNSQVENLISALGFAGNAVSPVPISASNITNTVNSPGANAASVALAATGLSRTSAPKKAAKGKAGRPRGSSKGTVKGRLGGVGKVSRASRGTKARKGTGRIKTVKVSTKSRAIKALRRI